MLYSTNMLFFYFNAVFGFLKLSRMPGMVKRMSQILNSQYVHRFKFRLFLYILKENIKIFYYLNINILYYIYICYFMKQKARMMKQESLDMNFFYPYQISYRVSPDSSSVPYLVLHQVRES